MEKSAGSVRMGVYGYHESVVGFRCSGCNEFFEKPILATFSSGGSVKVYRACPRCLSKVGEVKHSKSDKSEQAMPSRDLKRVAVKSEENVKCKHFLGYLKKHPKNAPFPDECLVCDRMIECMVH